MKNLLPCSLPYPGPWALGIRNPVPQMGTFLKNKKTLIPLKPLSTLLLSLYAMILFCKTWCAILTSDLNLDKAGFIALLSIFSQHPLSVGRVPWYLLLFPNLSCNSTNIYWLSCVAAAVLSYGNPGENKIRKNKSLPLGNSIITSSNYIDKCKIITIASAMKKWLWCKSWIIMMAFYLI